MSVSAVPADVAPAAEAPKVGEIPAAPAPETAPPPEVAVARVPSAPVTPEEALDLIAPAEDAPTPPKAEPVAPSLAVATAPQNPEPAPVRIRMGGSSMPGRDAVRVNRPGAEVPEEAPAAEPSVAEAVPEDAPALRRHAAVWEAPAEAKPRLAVVLLDDGATDPQALATLPWPVSVALDPMAPDATARLAAYRAAGVEALVVAKVPEGAQPVDAAASLGDSLARLPETVAVLDLGEGGLAGRNAVAQTAMSVVAQEGRGVLLADDRLGAGLDLAGRGGVPAAEVLRDLDGEGQDEAAIRRGLDDAVRRAGQDGQAVVLGRATAETLAALAAWGHEGRAGEVTVAPVSGVLGAQ